MKGYVEQAAGTAASHTGWINERNLQDKEPPPVPMREPDGKQTVSDADSLRSVNRYEESGRGRIRTNAKGMAAEGVGKVFKGVVDSEGKRPTSEGFFTAPAERVSGPEDSQPGPVIEIHKKK